MIRETGTLAAKATWQNTPSTERTSSTPSSNSGTAAAVATLSIGTSTAITTGSPALRLLTEASKDSDAFGRLLQALAGPVAYVVMVMRADAYARFQACAPLLALRAAGATFDLMPPTSPELEDIVKRRLKPASRLERLGKQGTRA